VDAASASTVSFAPHPARIGEARRRVAGACEGLSRDLIEIAQLLTSELVGNAMEHGKGTITLTILRQRGFLRVEVGDDGPDRPRLIQSVDVLSGKRGLMLVEGFADGWGVRSAEDGPGKVVWFALKTPA
jgi:anti-sigma regulatory factor (Ser/Thr protein kinase)